MNSSSSDSQNEIQQISGIKKLFAGNAKYWLIALLTTFFASRLFLLLIYNARFSDIRLYFSYFVRYQELAAKGLGFFENQMFEYPPLMLSFILAPGFVSTYFGLPSFESYEQAFRTSMFLFDAAAFIALLWAMPLINSGLSVKQMSLRLLVYILLPLLLPDLIYDRLDMVIAAFITVSICLLGRKKIYFAGFLLGLAAAIKITPFIVAPVLALWLFTTNKNEEFKYTLFFWCSGLLIGFMPFSILVGSDAFQFVSYQSQRGLQIESIPASLGLLTAFVGATPIPIEEASAISLVFPGSQFFASIWKLCGLLVGAWLMFWLWTKRVDLFMGEHGLSHAVHGSTILFVTAFCFSSVFSPQFLFWILPLMILTTKNSKHFWILAGLLAADFALSLLIFPTFYRDLILMKTFAQAILLARNAIFISIAIGLFLSLKKSIRR